MHWMVMAVLSVCCTIVVPPSAVADEMKATMYDDGLACPANCDSHVVFAARHNGTNNAFAPPIGNRSHPAKCVVGQECVICFGEPDESCITAVYRGAGPPKGRFDFTPAFFSENCDRTDLPGPLAQECAALKPQVEIYRRRINCFEKADDEPCKSIIATAEQEKEADKSERDACLAEGEAHYNARQTDQSRQRSLGCNYEKFGTGKNSNGDTWLKLLPGACRDGTYVGPFGTDCCSNNLFAAAKLGAECRKFFPKP